MQGANSFSSTITRLMSPGKALLLDESLSLALAAARQVAFDWHIPLDRLYLNGHITEGLKEVLPPEGIVWTSKGLAALVHDDDKAEFYKQLHEALRGGSHAPGSLHNVRLRLQDKRMEWRRIDISGKVVERDNEGRALRMAGILTDLHQDDTAAMLHDDLAVTEKINSAILTAALDCIVSINHHGEIISFNQAAEHTFGHASKDVLGKKLADIIIPPAWRERHQQGFERFLATGESTLLNRRIEVTAQHADGSSFSVEMAVVPLSVDDKPVFTAFIRDISELKQAHAMLKDSARRYQQLVDLSPEAILVVQHDLLALANHAALRLLGAHTLSGLLGKSILDFIQCESHALYYQCAQAGLSDMSATGFVEQVWRRENGTAFNVEIGVSKVAYNDAPALQVVVRDITQRKRAEALQLGQNRILNMVATGVALTEILEEITRFAQSQSEHGICSILQLNADRTALIDCIAPALPGKYTKALGELSIQPGNGSCATAVSRSAPVVVEDIACDQLWESLRELALEHSLKACTSWPIFGRNKKILGTFALYFKDAVAPDSDDRQLSGICTNLAGIAIESRASEERIRYLAHYDGLTSLPNRFLFKEYLDLALRNAQRHGSRFAVLFLDLDKFKEINDTMGHDAGDHALREIARRMRACLRETDKIARMGGDEFYVLVEDLEHGRHAADVAQKLLIEAAHPVMVGGKECRLSASIGIGIYPEDGTTGSALLKNADNAMYHAKERGKNAFQFFSTPVANDHDKSSSFKRASTLYRIDEKRVGLN
ncbi:diguanylate cyclase domain-containing protein [Noviherbaspirillum saxi]|nr:diguanylate cyclase [Noviherbaspirillum saxi]